MRQSKLFGQQENLFRWHTNTLESLLVRIRFCLATKRFRFQRRYVLMIDDRALKSHA